ncbi:MAG: SDR family oxidoreductase [Proteobacteria bacterium]|nr:SDR family oxidoreductase [Pseudomonadota bacterium]MBU4328335.1 SDR family oxidoreductase [Pseudomonadota bacterium]
MGRPLVAALCAAGNDVVILSRKAPKSVDAPHSSCIHLEGDVSRLQLGLDADTYQTLCNSVDTIFHLAARTDFKGASVTDYAAVNINGVKNIYALAEEAGAHLHHISTAFVAGNFAGFFQEDDLDRGQTFRNGYEESKFRGEQYLHTQIAYKKTTVGSAVTIYRPGIILERHPSQDSINTFGPFIFLDGVFRILLASRRRNQDDTAIRIRGDATCSLPFIFDDDVVKAIMRISAAPEIHGRTFHLVSSQPCPNKMLEDVFNDAFGRQVARLVEANSFKEQPASPAEKVMTQKTAMYDAYLDLHIQLDRTHLEEIMSQLWRPAISEDELLSAFTLYLASKKENNADLVFLSATKRTAIEDYFEKFLPIFYGQQLIAGLASLSCQFWLDVQGCTRRTLEISQGRLISISSEHQGTFGYRVNPSSFLQMVSGKLSPQQGFFQGDISLEGNTMEALHTAFGRIRFYRDTILIHPDLYHPGRR